MRRRKQRKWLTYRADVASVCPDPETGTKFYRNMGRLVGECVVCRACASVGGLEVQFQDPELIPERYYQTVLELLQHDEGCALVKAADKAKARAK